MHKKASLPPLAEQLGLAIQFEDLPPELVLEIISNIWDIQTLNSIDLVAKRYQPLVNIQSARLYAKFFPEQYKEICSDPNYIEHERDWKKEYQQMIKREIGYLHTIAEALKETLLKAETKAKTGAEAQAAVKSKLESLRNTIFAIHSGKVDLHDLRETDPLFHFMLLQIGARFENQVILNAIFNEVQRENLPEQAQEKYLEQLLYYGIVCNQSITTLANIINKMHTTNCEHPFGKKLSAIQLAINLNRKGVFKLLLEKKQNEDAADGILYDDDASILLLACINPDILAMMLAEDFPYKFNVNAVDRDGFTTLQGIFFSIRNEPLSDVGYKRDVFNLASVKLLIEHGANLDFVTQGLEASIAQIITKANMGVNADDYEAILSILFAGKEAELINFQLGGKPLVYWAIETRQVGLLHYLIKHGADLVGLPMPNQALYQRPSALQYAVNCAYTFRLIKTDPNYLKKIRNEISEIINTIIESITKPSHIPPIDQLIVIQSVLDQKVNVNCLKTLSDKIDLNQICITPKSETRSSPLLFLMAQSLEGEEFNEFISNPNINLNIVYQGQTLLDTMLAKLYTHKGHHDWGLYLQWIYILIEYGAGCTATQKNIYDLWASMSPKTQEVMLKHMRPYPDVEATWHILYKFLVNERSDIEKTPARHRTKNLKQLLHLYEQLIAEVSQIPLLPEDAMKTRLKTIMKEIAIVAHHKQSTKKVRSLSSIFVEQTNSAWNHWRMLNENLTGEYQQAHSFILDSYKKATKEKPTTYRDYKAATLLRN